tara:strand:- start:2493 stop:3794 length:1302 start_codon:yes stop_codon:yes gene_type:complete
MLKKLKEIIKKTDHFLYRKFGSNKSTKFLENIKEAQIIFANLNIVGEEDKARFVGGCVRKAISDEYIDDIDIATLLKPEEVKKALNEKEIKVIDTGISHGTVTAILNQKKFEITTLRKDITTDGRHASVEFTTDWEKDALRRDFTINAIYADIEGRIYDPLNGISDLKEGKINFIGSPEDRIQEDYLRILRYFRFFLQYNKVNHDQNIIRSIKMYINGINKVSNERIFSELKKILLLDNANSLFFDETSKEIILNIFPQFKYHKRLNLISSLDKKLQSMFDNYLVLAILIVDETSDYEYFCHKYRTSNNLKDRFKNISQNFEKIQNSKFYSKEYLKKLIYLLGKNYVKDLILFSIVINHNKIKNIKIIELINYVNICKMPKFPISGEDLKEYGFEAGTILGKKLKLLEEKWINDNFVIDKKTIKKLLGVKNKN